MTSTVPENRSEMTTNLPLTKITDLNYDCLIHIFRSLDGGDLISTFVSCNKFEKATDYCFSISCREIVISSDASNNYYIKLKPECMEGNMEGSPLSEEDLEKTFKQFGKYFKEIIIYEIPFSSIIRYASQYCSADMKSLTVYRSETSRELITGCQSFFNRLEQLNVIGNVNWAWKKCLRWSTNLKYLSIYRDEIFTNPLMYQVYPRLESVVCDFHSKYSQEIYRSFKRHANLREIDIRNMFIPTTQNIDCMQNAEKLSINVSFADLQRANWVKLFQLQRLNYLRIQCSKYTIIDDSLLNIKQKSSTNLETLDLCGFSLNHACTLLSKFTFTNLRAIHLDGIWNFKPKALPHMNTMFFENLSNVEELHFYHCPEGFFDSIILLFVQNMRNLERLFLAPGQDTFDSNAIQKLADIQCSKNSMITVYYKDVNAAILKAITDQDNLDSSLKFLSFKQAKLNIKFRPPFLRIRVREQPNK